MSLEKRIERMKNRLNAAVTTTNVCDIAIVKLSQRLDKLIVKKMRRDLA